MNVYAFAIPRGQSMNCKGVTQIVGPWADATARPLEAQMTQDTPQGLRGGLQGNRATVSANEQSVGPIVPFAPQKLIALRPVLAKLASEVLSKWNESSATFARAYMQHPCMKIHIRASQPNGLAKTQAGAIGRENEQAQQARPKVTALMAAGGFHHSLDLHDRENVWHIVRLGLRRQTHARDVSPRVPAAPKMAELPHRPQL
jgi:hypothetical protein